MMSGHGPPVPGRRLPVSPPVAATAAPVAAATAPGIPATAPAPAHVPAPPAAAHAPSAAPAPAHAWSHPSPPPLAQGLGMRGGAPGGFFPAPRPLLLPAPQQAHLGGSSSVATDRRSPRPGPLGAWGSMAPAARPAPRVPAPPSVHSGCDGPGSPLFSLQMLVNQEMSRATVPGVTTQREGVDLSSASGEAFSKAAAPEVSPLSLTRGEKLSSEHALRNGSAAATTTVTPSIAIPSAVSVTSTNILSAAVTSAPMVTSVNGEVSSISALGGGNAVSHNLVELNKERSIQKNVTDSKNPMLKEPVSVIAQTPPRERQRTCPVSSATAMDSSLTAAVVSQSHETSAGQPYGNHVESSGGSTHMRVAESVPQLPSGDASPAPIPSSSTDLASSPSPAQSPPSAVVKDTTAQKSAHLKRNMKVDSILGNLVEHGTKKILPVNPPASVPASSTVASTCFNSEQPPQAPVSTVAVAPASVIVSPPAVVEDGSSTRDMNPLSPSTSLQKMTPGERSYIDGEGDVSPTFSDDADNSKARRKRKLDKPVRMSKTTSDADPTATSSSETSESNRVQNLEVNEKIKTESESEQIMEVESEESVEAIAKDLHRHITPKIESVQNEVSCALTGELADKEIGDKANPPTGDTDSLLSDLVSENERSHEVKPDSKNPFIEVESELEKMFAGIVETEEDSTQPPETPVKESSLPDSAPAEETSSAGALENLNTLSTSSEVKRVLKRGRPKGSRNSSRRSSDSIFGTSADGSPKKKKKQPKRYFEDAPGLGQRKKLKRTKFLHSNNRDSPMVKKRSDFLPNSVQASALYDSGSNTSSSRSRGPVVHIEGPRDSPYSVTIINAPSREDEDGNDKSASKKQVPTNSRRKNTIYHNDLEFRGKVSRAGGSAAGLFSSTLSARYDSVTTDPTWICVFCKRGPHTKTGQGNLGNGDLFGPYLVGKEKSNEVSSANPFPHMEAPADEKDITEAQKRGHKNKKSLRGAEMVEQFHQKMSKKMKRTHSMDVPMCGMIPIAPSAGSTDKEEGCYEVWVHEACAVWAAGVYLVGSHIVGLQEAVWGSVHTMCSKCGEGGANVGCVRRACEWRVHYGCALDQGWDLNEESYIARCHKHKNGSYKPENLLPT